MLSNYFQFCDFSCSPMLAISRVVVVDKKWRKKALVLGPSFDGMWVCVCLCMFELKLLSSSKQNHTKRIVDDVLFSSPRLKKKLVLFFIWILSLAVVCCKHVYAFWWNKQSMKVNYYRRKRMKIIDDNVAKRIKCETRRKTSEAMWMDEEYGRINKDKNMKNHNILERTNIVLRWV